MIRTFFFYMSFVFSLVMAGLMLPLWYVLGWLGLKSAQTTWGYYVSHNWARFLLLTAGVRVTVKGAENIPADRAVLFVSNHQGNFDIPVLFSSLHRPIGFLAKIELAKVPVLHAWMPKLGCVFIDRANPRQSIKAIQKCAEVLKGGHSVVIFPEGTRSRGTRMGDFKKGSLRLVEKAGVPIVPVTVNGTYQVMEARKNRINAANVSVTISPPVDYGGMSKEEQEDIGSVIRKAIAAKL